MFAKRNLLSKKDARKKVLMEPFERTTVSFYRYIKIANPREFRDMLYEKFTALGILGRIYVSVEGINAQISVPQPQWDAFRALLESIMELKEMPLKIGVHEGDPSFIKLTIKVREYIVADGLPHDSYDLSNIGKHLTAKEWNELMDNPDTIVVDMRNAYESKIGRFKNAVTPQADTFKEELPMAIEQLKGNEDKPILLYCTGGVRCEKTSAYFKHHGFKNVNQLFGGIINYAHQVADEELENKFVGDNYVFDGRTAEHISDDVLSECDVCHRPSNHITNCNNAACNLLFIECEKCSKLLDGCCSIACYDIYHLPLDKQKEIRKAIGPSDKRDYRYRVKPNLLEPTASQKFVLRIKNSLRTKKQVADEELLLPGKYIAKVRHYYKKAQVIEFYLEGLSLSVGDTVVIRGNTTAQYEVVISELRVDGNPATTAKTGDLVSIRVPVYTRDNDLIFKK